MTEEKTNGLGCGENDKEAYVYQPVEQRRLCAYGGLECISERGRG